MAPHGSPRRRTRSGTVRRVSSSGWTEATSSQLQGRRDLPADPRPDEPGAEDRLVRGVLVEVDEHPLPPLLLPPLGRDQVGMAPFELPGQGDGAGSDLEAVPEGLQAHVHVDAPVARGLGVADDAELVEQGADVPGG